MKASVARFSTVNTVALRFDIGASMAGGAVAVLSCGCLAWVRTSMAVSCGPMRQLRPAEPLVDAASPVRAVQTLAWASVPE